MFVMSYDVTNIPLADMIDLKLPLNSTHNRVYCSRSKDYESIYSYHRSHAPMTSFEMFSIILANTSSFY